MNRRIMRKVHKAILKASVVLAVLTFVVSGSMIDTHSWTPTIICAVCILYLAVFVYANRRDWE